MKYKLSTPPSSTSQEVNIDINLNDDGRVSVSHTVTGTTPIKEPEIPTIPEIPPVNSDKYELIYQNNFDKLSDLTTNNGQYGNGTVIDGAFYSKPANVSSGIRSELQISTDKTPDEGAMEWDAKYEVIVANNGHSWQIHPATSGGSASPGLWHINGKFVLVNWAKGINKEYPTNQTIPQNKWNKYRIEYKMGSKGYLRFFINGDKVLDKSGIQVGDGTKGWAKIGWNGWGSDAAKSRIWYDNFKVFRVR
jgi:hypothetical protein